MRRLLKGEIALLLERQANFRGHDLQKIRIRGTGILALTPSRLVFAAWGPFSGLDLEIPLSRIESASASSHFMGLAKALNLQFKNASGVENACTWQIPDPDIWVAKLAVPRV
ncbi:MAG: hypothetical protein FD180_3255 [Planctomycetota bacterium]|nr:MAG: hypothetical protein FD180_3255 [Planctomycetota bacterium]